MTDQSDISSIDWLTGRSIYWLIHWLTDRIIYWLICKLVNSQVLEVEITYLWRYFYMFYPSISQPLCSDVHSKHSTILTKTWFPSLSSLQHHLRRKKINTIRNFSSFGYVTANTWECGSYISLKVFLLDFFNKLLVPLVFKYFLSIFRILLVIQFLFFPLEKETMYNKHFSFCYQHVTVTIVTFSKLEFTYHVSKWWK